LVDHRAARVPLDRLETDLAVAELPAAAGLLLVAALSPRLVADRLEVRHAWLVQVDLDVEAVLEPRYGDLDVHLREPREELLARLLVAAQVERRVLLGEAAPRRGHLLLVPLRLGRDREAHHRLRKADLRELERLLRIEKQVARH